MNRLFSWSRRAERGAGLAAQLEKARALLVAGRAAKAVEVLEAALISLEGLSALDARHCEDRDELALLLPEACTQAGQADARAGAAERLHALGARGPSTVLLVAAHRALVEKRDDFAAVDSYLDALALGLRLDNTLRERLQQILAYRLHVGLDSTEAEIAARLARLERLKDLRPHLSFPRLYLGRARYLRRQWAAAVTELAAIPGRLATSPKVLNILGRSLEKLGRGREAMGVYRRSLAADGRQAAIHFRLGRALLASVIACTADG